MTPSATTPPTNAHSPSATPLRLAALLLLAGIVLRFFDPISRVLLAAYAAAVVAVIMNAGARRLPLGRKWAALMIGLLIVALLVALLWFGGGLLLGQASGLVHSLPSIQDGLKARLAQLNARTGIDLTPAVDALDPSSLLGPGLALRIAAGLRSTIGVLVLFFAIVFGGLFAMASPHRRLLTPLYRAIPEPHRPQVARALQLLQRRLLGWLRGRLIGMVAVGLLALLAFWLLGLPYALLLAVVNGLTEFIPIFGPILGAIPAIVLGLVQDPLTGLWVLLAAWGIQLVENNLIEPVAMSAEANVHPFVTLFAVLLFGTLFGFLGVLLAMPIVLLIWSAIQVFWVEARVEQRGGSAESGGGADAPSG